MVPGLVKYCSWLLGLASVHSFTLNKRKIICPTQTLEVKASTASLEQAYHVEKGACWEEHLKKTTYSRPRPRLTKLVQRLHE